LNVPKRRLKRISLTDDNATHADGIRNESVGMLFNHDLDRLHGRHILSLAPVGEPRKASSDSSGTSSTIWLMGCKLASDLLTSTAAASGCLEGR
jgi:hypothetical protein